jgi:hypothetical protein
MKRPALLVCCAAAVLLPSTACAQNNYEIQVYASDTVRPGVTMFETHSNFTFEGQKYVVDGVVPTEHLQHETEEITTGVTDWAEVGFYLFTYEKNGQGVQWVGDHVRPRVRVPDSWHWPVGVSLSTEIGYQRAAVSLDTWTWEIRPIVDKQAGRWYLAFNPALERTWHGPDVDLGIDFSPAVKVGFDFTKKVNAGVEYYADYGRITDPYPLRQQQQQLFVATDLNVSPRWEINFGVGVGATAATDHLIAKCIIGRRWDWSHRSLRPASHASPR